MSVGVRLDGLMDVLIVLPVVLPLLAAAVSVLFSASRSTQRLLAFGMTVLVFACGVLLAHEAATRGLHASQLAGWEAPIGVTFVADLLASSLVAITGFVGFAVVLYARDTLEALHERAGFHPVLLLLLGGLNGAFLTGDLFNLFVWFEVLLLASFILLSLGGGAPQLEGGLKYATLNVIASGVLLSAVGITYGLAGTVNLAELSLRIAETRAIAPWNAVLGMLLVAFGIKAALFPLFFWLPASYHTPPVVVTALFSALLSKVGLYALIRTFGTVFGPADPLVRNGLMVIALLTMVTGVLGAVAQYDLKRLLAFHIVSQVGYVVLALALGSVEALAAGLAFMVHVIFAKSALFLFAGLAERLQGTSDLKRMGGLYAARPVLSLLFLAPALSLAGMPPFSGFVAKFAIVRSAVRQEAWLAAGVAVGVGLLTLFSMIKIWREAFWKRPAEGVGTEGPLRVSWIGATLLLAAWSVLLGVFAEPLMNLSLTAAEQLLDRSAYARAVLGGR